MVDWVAAMTLLLHAAQPTGATSVMDEFSNLGIKADRQCHELVSVAGIGPLRVWMLTVYLRQSWTCTGHSYRCTGWKRSDCSAMGGTFALLRQVVVESHLRVS